MPDIITIGETHVARGENAEIHLNIARLPTHTLIQIPVYVFRAEKSGPILLLCGGMHGDELNGIEIVRRIIATGRAQPEIGTVICVPVINIYGFLNASRDLPDGRDLNRSFPGSKNGSLASRIAYVLMKEIVPHIDYGIDFHTGGASRTNYPQLRCTVKHPGSLKLAKAFAPPFIIDSEFRPSSFRKEASKHKKQIFVYEGGESLRFDEFAIMEGVNGTLRFMNHLGMAAAPKARHKTVIIGRDTWMRARSSGLFHSYVRYGSRVEIDELIGSITDPFGETEYEVRADMGGYILGLNNMPIVNKGDAIVHIGREK
ncbi:MAG TPA: succinylglutamate desuccinylase/aspartoacylase family protein [Patescibacteria group bacterium]|nr:succinylglutamate desuccinylase/aspartoacylase family protein [Patescibacteria group bacterium]